MTLARIFLILGLPETRASVGRAAQSKQDIAAMETAPARTVSKPLPALQAAPQKGPRHMSFTKSNFRYVVT
jgi:hypothetical protein